MTVRARQRSTEPGLQAMHETRGAKRLPLSTPCSETPTRSVQQPQRHYETEIARRVRPPLGLERRGALGRLEGELHFLGWDIAQNLEQIVRIESDVERVAVKAYRQLVSRLAEIGCLHAESHERRVERKSDAMGLIRRDDGHASQGARQGGAIGNRDTVVVSRYHLIVRWVWPLDQPRGNPRERRPKAEVILPSRDLVFLVLGKEASYLLERLGRYDEITR